MTGHSVFSGKEKAVNRCSYSQIQSTVKLKLTVGLAIHRQIGQASAYVTVWILSLRIWGGILKMKLKNYYKSMNIQVCLNKMRIPGPGAYHCVTVANSLFLTKHDVWFLLKKSNENQNWL